MQFYGLYYLDDRNKCHREPHVEMLPRMQKAWQRFLQPGVCFEPGGGWRNPRQLERKLIEWEQFMASTPEVCEVFADIKLPEPWDPKLRALTGLIGPPDAVQATIVAHRQAWEEQQQARMAPAWQVRRTVGRLFVPTDVLHIVTAGHPSHYPDDRSQAKAILYALRVLREAGWERRHVKAALVDPRMAGLHALMGGRFDHWWRYAARGRRISRPRRWSPTVTLPPLEAQWLSGVRAAVDVDRQSGTRSTVRHKRLAEVVAVAEALARRSAQATAPTFDSSARHLAAEAGVERRHGVTRAVQWLSPYLEVAAGSNVPGRASATRYRLLPPKEIRPDVQDEVPVLEPLWTRQWHLRETWLQAHLCEDLAQLADRLNAPLAQLKRELKELERLDAWDPDKHWGRALTLPAGPSPVMVEADRLYGEQRAADTASGYKRAVASKKPKAHSTGTSSTRTRVA
jgi:hypothetical protein